MLIRVNFRWLTTSADALFNGGLPHFSKQLIKIICDFHISRQEDGASV